MRGDLRDFVGRVEQHDGEPALSEYKAMRLVGRLDVRERVAVDDGVIVGYGQAAWHRGAHEDSGHWAIEIVVDPASRESGVGRQLIESLRLESPDSAMTLWARAPYVAVAAQTAGWHKYRDLLEMRRLLPIECPEVSFGDLTITTFRVGADEASWLAANNAAFAGHPESGSMTRRDLEERIAQAWFDAEGFFLAWEGDRLVGSCWTKIHDDGAGEIYIVGVVPQWKGHGLGRALVCHGLDYLGRVRHVSKAKLYAEADNHRAVGLYATLGFEVTTVVEAYRHSDDG